MGQDPQFAVVPDRRTAASAVKFYRIRDLDQYQHYKNRSPPWVKLHGAQLEDYEFQQLPDATRFHALALTYMASKSGNKIPNDPVWVAGRIGAHEPVDLARLFECGFLEEWKPRPQDAYSAGEQLDLPAAETAGVAGAGETPTGSTSSQDASNLLAQSRAETESETHTETDTASASAARLCGCCQQSVCSEFSYGEALALAQQWKAEGRLVGGRPIENPGGLARVLHKEGTAEDDIKQLLRPPPRREFTAEDCPTCLGTKWQTVQGKGARECPDCLDERGMRTGKRAKDYGGRGP